MFAVAVSVVVAVAVVVVPVAGRTVYTQLNMVPHSAQGSARDFN